MSGTCYIDLSAIAENVEFIRGRVAPAGVMAVVKADAYAHGIVSAALAALDGGARWLGVASADEAMTLREGGVAAPIFAWMAGDDDLTLRAAIGQEVTLSVSDAERVERIARAAREERRVACLHVEIDTGMGRGGALPSAWDRLFGRLREEADRGHISVRGIWTHLARADESGRGARRSVLDQQLVFERAVDFAAARGLRSLIRHAANSAATFAYPQLRYDMVRAGLAIYGASPLPGYSAGELGLRPAMSLESTLSQVKHAPPGTPVSYGQTYHTKTATLLGLVPVGYADGVPRHAEQATVLIGERSYPVVGRVCMDQVIVDLGPSDVGSRPSVGDRVIVFGDPRSGAASANDWADRAGTVPQDMLARLGRRLRRDYVSHSHPTMEGGLTRV